MNEFVFTAPSCAFGTFSPTEKRGGEGRSMEGCREVLKASDFRGCRVVLHGEGRSMEGCREILKAPISVGVVLSLTEKGRWIGGLRVVAG